MGRLSITLLLMVSVVLLSACQTGKEQYNIGNHEKIELPEGLFGKSVNKRKWAVREVSYYFQAGKDKLTSNPALMMKQMAYFEYLVNDLKRGHDVPAQKLRKLLDTRDDLRKMILIPSETTASDAINQLFSMSKMMAVTTIDTTMVDSNDDPLKSALVATKTSVDKLIDQLLELKENSEGQL